MVPIRFGSPKTLEYPNIKTPEERVKYYGQSNHLRYYGLDFKDRLEEAGFNVKVEDYIKVFDEASKDKYGLPKKDYIYFCTKRISTKEYETKNNLSKKVGDYWSQKN